VEAIDLSRDDILKTIPSSLVGRRKGRASSFRRLLPMVGQSCNRATRDDTLRRSLLSVAGVTVLTIEIQVLNLH
jgi:hypothetical protein